MGRQILTRINLIHVVYDVGGNKHATFQTGKPQGKGMRNDVIVSNLWHPHPLRKLFSALCHGYPRIILAQLTFCERCRPAVKVFPTPPTKKFDENLTATIEMCRYHAVPAKVPSNPRKAELHLPQGHSSPSYPHPHFHPSKSSQIHNDSQKMEPPPATANPLNNNTHHRIETSSFMDLSFLQEEYDDDEEDRGKKEWVDDCGSDDECSTPQHPVLFPAEQLCHILQGVCSCRTQLEATVLRDVREALWILGLSAQNEAHSNLHRHVMNNLRCAGYNAGICKSRWEQTNGYPAGEYEFIDVIVGGKSNDRLLVDMDFRAQFEIARPTAEYAALVEVLPTLLVGSADKLRDIIWIMCDAAKRSLKAKGMHLPPWRKKRYIEAKWLASHKRTTSHDQHQQNLLLTQWNACFLHRNNLRSTGRISGLGRALAQAVTHNNTNNVC